jgi:hypothetical protein
LSQADGKTRELATKITRNGGRRWSFASLRNTQEVEERDGKYWTRELTAHDGTGNLSLTFEPAVPDLYQAADGEYRAHWKVSMHGLDLSAPDIMSGDLLIEKQAPKVEVHLRPASPPWAQTMSLVTEIELGEASHTVASHVELTGH